MLLVTAVCLLCNLQAKKVHTIGDSTMAPYDENATDTRGWGMYFGNFLTNGWTSVNYAKGGRDARSGYNELWQAAKNNVEAGDYVIIQFGHNDEMFNGADHDELVAYLQGKGETFTIDSRGTNPTSTYKTLLKKICDEVKAKGAQPILVSPACRFWFTNGQIRRSAQHDLGDGYSIVGDSYTYSATAGFSLSKTHTLPADDHTMDYSYQMQQLAIAENIPFVDITKASKELYESYGQERCAAELQSFKWVDGVKTIDGTHFQTTGALLVARLCAQLMKEQDILADGINVPTDLSVNPSSLEMGESYKGMTLTKEMTINGFGLDPASGTITVTASGDVELSLDKNNWKQELSIDYSSGTLVQTIYVRIVLASAGSINETITLTNGSQTIQVPVSAKGIELSTGAPVSINWPLTANNEATKDGSVEIVAQGLHNMEIVDYAGDLQRLQVAGGAWSAAEDDDPSRYISFGLKSTSNNTIKIDNIALKVGGAGGNDVNCHVYYTTDGFQTRTTLLEKNDMTSGTMYEVKATTNISLEKDQMLEVRIYPWCSTTATGRYLCLQGVTLSGVEEGAGLENEPATINYVFNEGKAGQSATFGPKTQASTWFKSSYVEVGSNLSYVAKSLNGTSQTGFQPAAKHNSAGDATDNIDFIFIPKKGLLFTPTKVSFKVCRYGTNGGNMVYSWVDGEGNVTKIGEKVGGKELFAQNTIQEFSFDVNGVNATAGNNSLRINLYGLDNNKQVGFSDIVIEGKLTGVPQNVTQYRLTTRVANDEAGKITVTPAGTLFDEGDKVSVMFDKNFGYQFIEWQDANGQAISTANPYEVTINDNTTLVAITEKVPIYKVTTDITNDADRELGSITLSPNDHNGQYEAGTKITAKANESKILKFLNWADDFENNNASATRELTVNSDMKLVANYEVQDFIAVFDASKTASYAYSNTSGYPFSADEVWDNQRNAKASVVKMSDGSLCYTQNSGTPVVRNRQSVVISGINGLYQNGYHTADIAWQYQFSTKGFTSATFNADMCAKNAATKQYKALISVDGGAFTELKAAWDVTANVVNPIAIQLPADAIGKELVTIRITGAGDELYSTSYPFDKTFDGLRYSTNSESGVGNVYILGEAEFIADEVAPKVTATIPANNATGVSATGKITISFDEKIQAGPVNGVATLTAANGSPVNITPAWSSRSVSFDYAGLDYNTAYTFQMPAGFVQDKSGNQYAEAVNITFTTMNRPSVEKALYDFIVPDMGTIDVALAAANGRADKNTRYRVFIKNSAEPYVFHPAGKVTGGDGKEYDNPTSVLSAANTSFIGESIEGVVITNVTPDATWDNGFGAACPLEGIGKGDVLLITGADSYFQNLTIKTSMGDAHGRDIAVNDKSNRTIFKDAQLWGYQDTYVSNNQNGKFYFEGGIIRGRTDYVCGKGDVYYNKVTFQQVKSGYLAVPSQPKKYGYIFQSCKIVGETEDVDGNYTLGRPWGKGTPIALFIDTEMEVVPSAIGWSEMSGGYPKRMAEYGSHTSKGVAVDLTNRKTIFDAYDKDDDGNIIESTRHNETNNPVLTAEEAAQYTLETVMGQDDQWQPTLATEQAPVPADVKLEGSTLTWADSNYALLWAVCKDGNVIAFTTEPTYTVSADGVYTVRAANEMGGLSAPSISASTTAIETIANSQSPTAISHIYTLDGKQLQQMQKGVNIVRMSDGQIRKVILR